MSQFSKKPYIEAVLSELSGINKTQFLNFINGLNATGTSSITYTLCPTISSLRNVSSGVTPVTYTYSSNIHWKGYVIKTTHYIAFATFKNDIDLNIADVYEVLTSNLNFKEQITSDYLRALLREDSYIDNSELAAVANAKQDDITDSSVESGSVSSMLGLDSEGNLVKGTVPEGSVVDSELDIDSTNPVENKAITQAIDDIKDGQTVVAKALTAKQLDNVGTDSGTTQEEPFIFQATATENGMSPDTETAPIAKQLEKQGNSVVVNQIAPSLSSAYTNGSYGTKSVSSGVFTWTRTSSDVTNIPVLYYAWADLILKGTNYYWCCFDINPSQNCKINVYAGSNFVTQKSITADTWTTVLCIMSNPTAYFQIMNDFSGLVAVGETIKIRNLSIVDLSQWGFSADELTDITTTPSHFFRYYAGSLANNAGTLTNAISRYLDCIGRNQWDEEISDNYYYAPNGTKTSTPNYACCKNKIRVIPNAKMIIEKGSDSTYGGTGVSVRFYDVSGTCLTTSESGTWVYFNTSFTVPGNACEMVFNSYFQAHFGNKPEITLSLYYEDGTGYDKHYPYVKNSYDTGEEVLLSAGSVRDIKKPSGEITRKIGTYTFTGSETFDDYIGDGKTLSIAISGLKKPSSNSAKANVLWAIGTSVPFTSINATATPQNSIAVDNDSGRLYIKTTKSSAELATALTGVVLYFEKATPTSEEGTPFAENVEVDNYGTMSWRSATTPQGCKFFYPADYVEFIDSIGMRDDIEFDASKIVSSTQLSTEGTVRADYDVILKNAIGGTLRHLLANKHTIDFNDTVIVDLGSLTWASGTIVSTNALNGLIKAPTDQYAKAHILCTKYQTSAQGDSALTSEDLQIAYSTGGDVRIYDTSFSGKTATQIQQALKGVLLAYEKAE